MDDTKLPWHVYLLTCADGTLYCGVTNDLTRRLAEHNAGTGAKYTRSRLPVVLTASAPCADRAAAQVAEAAVKRRPRERKVDFLRALAAAPRFGQPDPAPAPEAPTAQAAPEKKSRSARAPKGKAPQAAPKVGSRAAEPEATPEAQAPETPRPEAAAAPKPRARGKKAAPEMPAAQPAPTPAPGAATAKAKTSKSKALREARPEAEAQPAPRGKGRAVTPRATPEAQAPAAPEPEAAAAPRGKGKTRKAAAQAPEVQPAARAEAPAPQPGPAPEAAAPGARGKGKARAAASPAPEATGTPAARPQAQAAPAREPRPKAKKAPKARPAEAAPQAAPTICLPPRDLLDRRLTPRRAVPDVEPLRGKITKEDISLLPLGTWCGEIVIVDTPRAAEAAARDMRAETVLGFDTESRPAFMKGRYYLPSLIQMATTETVYIYMLGRLAFPESLMAIFENPDILKTGVAVRDDVKDLQRITPFAARGFIDLGVVALLHKLDTHGLRNLAAKFLGIRISKAARCTNWANPRLTPAQINYAATDAWISRELFLAMDREGLIEPARDYDNGNGAEQAKDSKTRARVRRGGRSRRR